MVSFKMFAGTNVGLRENNEDNFTVSPDLTKNEWIVPADNQQVIQLGSRGCVMAVADGMGGQNAGEVASAIAIDTVEEMFSPNNLSSDVFAKSDTIISFLKKVISECDIRIKKRTEEDPSTEGMGSTIVISWLIGRKLYIAWLGDSRAYSFVKTKGIARLSKDHSYVQQLVDAGAITDEEAMSHPNSNVITRSLGDTSQKAKADVAEYDIEDDQIVLLCSDGLCGVCKDEEIGGIIEEGCSDLQGCKESLTTAALAAGGSDNITISLLHIQKDNTQTPTQEDKPKRQYKMGIKTILASTFGLCLFAAFIYGVFTTVIPEDNVVKSLRIWLESDTLSIKEKTSFHVLVKGDSVSTLVYDKNLIDVNLKDCTISVRNLSFLLEDTTTYLRAVCHNDPGLTDSVSLYIKRKLVLPPAIEKIRGKENGNKLPAKSYPSSDLTTISPTLPGPSSSITPSNGTQTEITKIEE
jgi:serine/threonine protein phosphatase PrpC